MEVRLPSEPLKKFLMRVYLNYTLQQEAMSKNSSPPVRIGARPRHPGVVFLEYRRLNLPMMKYYAILTTNTRMIVMAACVRSTCPALFRREVVGINRGDAL